MPVPGDTILSARTGYPDTIIAGEDAFVRLELVRDGVAVVPSDNGDVELVDGSGTVKATIAATIDAGGALAATIPAATTTDLELGQLYQLRWNPTIAPSTVPDFFRCGDLRTPFRSRS